MSNCKAGKTQTPNIAQKPQQQQKIIAIKNEKSFIQNNRKSFILI